jgi:hypothetical protein
VASQCHTNAVVDKTNVTLKVDPKNYASVATDISNCWAHGDPENYDDNDMLPRECVCRCAVCCRAGKGVLSPGRKELRMRSTEYTWYVGQTVWSRSVDGYAGKDEITFDFLVCPACVPKDITTPAQQAIFSEKWFDAHLRKETPNPKDVPKHARKSKRVVKSPHS